MTASFEGRVERHRREQGASSRDIDRIDVLREYPIKLEPQDPGLRARRRAHVAMGRDAAREGAQRAELSVARADSRRDQAPLLPLETTRRWSMRLDVCNSREQSVMREAF